MYYHTLCCILLCYIVSCYVMLHKVYFVILSFLVWRSIILSYVTLCCFIISGDMMSPVWRSLRVLEGKIVSEISSEKTNYTAPRVDWIWWKSKWVSELGQRVSSCACAFLLLEMIQKYSAVQRSSMQGSAGQHTVVQCSVVCCSAVYCSVVKDRGWKIRSSRE